MNPVLDVKNVTKVFYLRPVRGVTSIKEKILGTSPPTEEGIPHRVTALQEITFQAAAGDGIGLIGNNGAGKSTLLKVIAGIYEPSAGTICSRGRVTSLLGLGTGFHSDLTGRENIYLNASLYGLQNRDIRGLVPDIANFSELGNWLDHPIKVYSAGMVARLAFSIATHLDPELLLLDEIFAVGDVGFQRKCEDKLKALKAGGVTVLMSSHQPSVIEALCERAICLKSGRMVAQGPAAEILRVYLSESVMRRPFR